MDYLFEKLKETRDSDVYPYHMPGHKRQACGELSEELCGLDITEIDGFDNLHEPRDLLLELQQKAAVLYGAEESFYLVNGSTAGVLSAVSAALPYGGHILMARNCHKSAYHAVYLRGLSSSYLMPPVLEGWDMPDAVTPEQVRSALSAEPETGAVLLVSPTYEGRVSDIRAIADIVHAKRIPLIVDEAHGAHLGFGDGFSDNSCQAGADLVIHSMHKTLPALTQAALLHVNGTLIDRERLRRFLHIYQTSSPSYLLMASIDNALRFVEKEGKEAFAGFERSYQKMIETLASCRKLRVLSPKRGQQDIGKLVISVRGTGLSGRELYDTLRERYSLQPEMAAESYVLAMFTVNDTPEGYRRMTEALLEIDSQLPVTGERCADGAAEPACSAELEQGKACIPLGRAWDMDRCRIELRESVGCYAGDFVNLYPPGVPVLVPGERITESLCDKIKFWLETGLSVQGVEKQAEKIFISILKIKNC